MYNVLKDPWVYTMRHEQFKENSRYHRALLVHSVDSHPVETVQGIIQLSPLGHPQELATFTDHLHVLAVLGELVDEVVGDLAPGVVGSTSLVGQPPLDLLKR